MAYRYELDHTRSAQATRARLVAHVVPAIKRSTPLQRCAPVRRAQILESWATMPGVTAHAWDQSVHAPEARARSIGHEISGHCGWDIKITLMLCQITADTQ